MEKEWEKTLKLKIGHTVIMWGNLSSIFCGDVFVTERRTPDQKEEGRETSEFSRKRLKSKRKVTSVDVRERQLMADPSPPKKRRIEASGVMSSPSIREGKANRISLLDWDDGEAKVCRQIARGSSSISGSQYTTMVTFETEFPSRTEDSLIGHRISHRPKFVLIAISGSP